MTARPMKNVEEAIGRPPETLALPERTRLAGKYIAMEIYSPEVLPLRRIEAIGDSVHTDLKGAAGYGLDCLFVTGGIHAEELGAREAPDLAALDGIFAAAGVAPKAVTRRLVW